jgi:cell wall-associated NlpC family hydrolase
LGFRVNGLRAITLGSILAIAGVSIPTAFAVTANPFPAPDTSDRSAPGGSSFASRLPASDRHEAVPSPASAAPDWVTVVPPITVRSAAPRQHAAAAVAGPRPKAKPKPKPTPTPASAHGAGRGAKVARIALAQRGDRYVSGASGPDAFDWSGLVRYAYRLAGVSGKLGGGHSASAMYAWGRSHGLTSRTNPRVGDVVIYGSGSHAGIYIGGGRIISALNSRQGIRITGLHALGAPFTAFIHTRI